MKRCVFLLLALLPACGSDSTFVGDPATLDVAEIPPMTGRWVGTSGTGESVDLQVVEILHDVGGLGTVTRSTEEFSVGVLGRHDGRVVTLHVSAPGQAWDFQGNVVSDGVDEIRGTWTTFTGSTGITLYKCDPGLALCQ